MTFQETSLKGSFVIKLSPFSDERGWFARTYSKEEFKQTGFSGDWVQINHSFTGKKGTIRGLHYQLPPYSEVKLVRCIRGMVYDVIVDLRSDSPTFLQSFSVELSAEAMNSLLIPEGFAHGFQALTDNCELIYLHSTAYQPGFEGGLKFDDSKLNINWPLDALNLSQRDLNHPPITESFKGI